MSQQPEELLKAGQLDECLAAVEQAIRKNPADPKLRIMMFQVLSVMGQWDRAQTQLATVSQMDKSAALMAQMYTQAILCERLRNEVWSGKRMPLVLGEPEAWVGLLLQAHQMLANGKVEAADELRAQAFEQAPAVAGKLKVGKTRDDAVEHPFEWIADVDQRLGPLLEAVVDGKYYWVPWSRVALLVIEKPEDLRDMVWAPVNFVWTSGGEQVGLIPTRYPGSDDKRWDAGVRLARKTIFDSAGGYEAPYGQRMLATDEGEFAMLDIRSIRLGEGPLRPEATEADIAAVIKDSIKLNGVPGAGLPGGGAHG